MSCRASDEFDEVVFLELTERTDDVTVEFLVEISFDRFEVCNVTFSQIGQMRVAGLVIRCCWWQADHA